MIPRGRATPLSASRLHLIPPAARRTRGHLYTRGSATNGSKMVGYQAALARGARPRARAAASPPAGAARPARRAPRGSCAAPGLFTNKYRHGAARVTGPGLRRPAADGPRSTARAPPQLRKRPTGRRCRALGRASSFQVSATRKEWPQSSRRCLHPACKLHTAVLERGPPPKQADSCQRNCNAHPQQLPTAQHHSRARRTLRGRRAHVAGARRRQAGPP
jgi:hypothetical protein